jgi:hypothetical protein
LGSSKFSHSENLQSNGAIENRAIEDKKAPLWSIARLLNFRDCFYRSDQPVA